MRIKFKRGIILFLAISMMLGLASCGNKKTREIVVETTGITVVETTEKDALDNSVIDPTETTNSELFEVVNPVETKISAKDAYDIYMEFVDTINEPVVEIQEDIENTEETSSDENSEDVVEYIPEKYYSFAYTNDDGLDFPFYLGVAETNEEHDITSGFLYGIVDGEVQLISEQETLYMSLLSYDNFKKLPTFTYSVSAAVFSQDSFVSELSDGAYVGKLCAFSPDGSKALLRVSDPIVYTKEEYEALVPGDKVERLYESPYFSEAYFDNTLEEGGTILGTISFVENSNGDYEIAFSDGMRVEKNSRYIVIDVSPDLLIYDPTNWENSECDENGLLVTELPFDSGDNNFCNTFLYRELMAGGQDDYYYDPIFMEDEWVIVDLPIKNMLITNNQLMYAEFK